MTHRYRQSEGYFYYFKNMMRAYNDKKLDLSSSSESEQEEESLKKPQQYDRAKNNPRSAKHHLEREEEDSSLSEEDSSLSSPRNLQRKCNLADDEGSDQDPEENSGKSIDHIEERIKKLQKDLEERIGKHKKQSGKQNNQNSNDRLKNSKNSNSPSTFKKAQFFSPGLEKARNDKKSQALQSQQPKQKAYHPDFYSQKQKIQGVSSRGKVKEAQLPTPKKQKINKESEIQKMPITVIVEKQKVESKTKNYESNQGYHGQRLAKANKQIQDLTKTINDLKGENRRLKEQVNELIKRKPLEEVDKLRELSCEGNVKLEKQLQLLKIIEVLQAKLKKSINRKLKKGKSSNTSSALLHKGLPANLLD